MGSLGFRGGFPRVSRWVPRDSAVGSRGFRGGFPGAKIPGEFFAFMGELLCGSSDKKTELDKFG